MLASAAKMGGKARPAAVTFPAPAGCSRAGTAPPQRGGDAGTALPRRSAPTVLRHRRAALPRRAPAPPPGAELPGAPRHFPSAAALGRAELPPPSQPATGPPSLQPPEPFAPRPLRPHRPSPRRGPPAAPPWAAAPAVQGGAAAAPAPPRGSGFPYLPSWLRSSPEASPAPRPPAGVAVSGVANKQNQGERVLD